MKTLAIVLWGKNRLYITGNKEAKTAYTGICATWFECDRNRASTSARGFLSCQKHVLPLARSAPSQVGITFAPSPSTDPRRLSRRRAFGEYGSALTILPSEPPRVSTGMIYAAAFHIFHCFQVFGSICKIKFVMREHSALLPTLRFPPPACLITTFCCAHESRRIWPTGQFPRVLKHRNRMQWEDSRLVWSLVFS